MKKKKKTMIHKLKKKSIYILYNLQEKHFFFFRLLYFVFSKLYIFFSLEFPFFFHYLPIFFFFSLYDIYIYFSNYIYKNTIYFYQHTKKSKK